MPVSRLAHIPGIGVDAIGNRADALNDPTMLRLENLDTDVRPPSIAIARTRDAVEEDGANSYLPFQGSLNLRAAAAAHVSRSAGRTYDPDSECVITAGGLNGVLNTLLATVEPGSEVVICDPIYAGLINRIRLAGAVPRFVSARTTPGGWATDPSELAAAVSKRTAAVLMMSPAMPTGALLERTHWEALATAMEASNAWLIYDAAMERIVFNPATTAHPTTIAGLRERTITVGSASKEMRMIGWRVGWVVGPAEIMRDIHLVGLTNVVCQVGLAQEAVAAALSAPEADADVARATAIWAERADYLVSELADYPIVPPMGGWSLLIDCAQLGLSPGEASDRLFERGRVAATGMSGWGPSGDRYLRLVYANEPVSRLSDIRDRFAAAWG